MKKTSIILVVMGLTLIVGGVYFTISPLVVDPQKSSDSWDISIFYALVILFALIISNFRFKGIEGLTSAERKVFGISTILGLVTFVLYASTQLLGLSTFIFGILYVCVGIFWYRTIKKHAKMFDENTIYNS